MELYLIAADSWWLQSDSWLAMFMVAAGLGALIFVHEMGHFLVAKACGVKCEKFYIGFDFFDLKIGNFVLIPRALVKFQWGETEYGVGIIPLGGYVKMLGQDDNPANAEREAERTKIQKSEVDGDETDETADVAQESDEQLVVDPRSYTAKSVPQRMAIISAGVIMNLIFAVILGTFAYHLGVDYTPCEIGNTVAGGPAWLAGMRPGDKIIQIGETGKARLDEHLRFTWDLRNAVAMAGDKKDLHLEVRRTDGSKAAIIIRPRLVGEREMPSIGILAAGTTTLHAKQAVYEHLPAGKTKKFEPNDRIVAVSGPSGRETVEDYFHLRAILTRSAGEDLTFTVERTVAGQPEGETRTETADITVQANYIKRIGLVMESGPVGGVLPGSPADQAGMKPGDVLKKIGENPLGDPMSLPHLMRSFYEKEVAIQVVRKGDNDEEETITLQVTPQTPTDFLDHFIPGTRPYLSVPSLGIVLPVRRTVLRVEPDSPAHEQGMRTGDEIVEVQYLTMDEANKPKSELPNGGEPLELDDYSITWPLIHGWMQHHEPHTKIKLIYKRGDELGSAEMAPVVTSEKELNPDRGFVFMNNSAVHKADSWSEAVLLGFRQTKEDSLKIVGFLRELATGGVSVTHLGGPGTIAVVATSEASQGPSRLLMFLVLISANLAVVNFLPIPVLDGGHMVFLIAEGIRGKPISERLQVGLTVAGLIFVAGLMLFVIGLDVWHLSGLSS